MWLYNNVNLKGTSVKIITQTVFVLAGCWSIFESIMEHDYISAFSWKYWPSKIIIRNCQNSTWDIYQPPIVNKPNIRSLSRNCQLQYFKSNNAKLMSHHNIIHKDCSHLKNRIIEMKRNFHCCCITFLLAFHWGETSFH